VAKPPAIKFEKKWLMVVEGDADRLIFGNLLERRGIDDFQVEVPRNNPDETGGLDRIGKFLATLPSSETFRAKVKAILIVADNDNAPEKQFKRVQDRIHDANKAIRREFFEIGRGTEATEVPIPESPQTPAYGNEGPAVVVLMLPWTDKKGALETLSLGAAYSRWGGIKDALEAYVKRTPAKDWDVTELSKMRMQCIIAATCEQDPNTPLSHLFERKKQYHFSTKNRCFDRVANFLHGFGDLVKSSGKERAGARAAKAPAK
jgi:hypothetical protein